MKTLALFGITGRTGLPLAEMLLQAGYKLKALARNPDKLTLKHPNLTVIRGDVLQYEDVRRTVEGTDAVISVIGPTKDSPPLMQTNGTRNIVKAMEQSGIRRIISMTGGGVAAPPDQPKTPDKLIKLLMKLVAKKALEDGTNHAEVLQNSRLDWTVVRGPRLTNGPLTHQYRVGWVGVNASTSASRKDIAHFIIKELEEGKYLRQMPFISN
jgi:putative NADH-flavin reductase